MGRYFECNYEKAAINATNCFDVVCHDGDSGMYHAANVFPIKPFGDGRGPCIAYYDDRAYAFKGRVEQYGHGRYYVIFDDGDKKWVAQDKVYKYEDLPQYSFGNRNTCKLTVLYIYIYIVVYYSSTIYCTGSTYSTVLYLLYGVYYIMYNESFQDKKKN